MGVQGGQGGQASAGGGTPFTGCFFGVFGLAMPDRYCRKVNQADMIRFSFGVFGSVMANGDYTTKMPPLPS
jgi:hypothetical protein